MGEGGGAGGREESGGGGGVRRKKLGRKKWLCACDCYGLALSGFMPLPNPRSLLCLPFLLSQFEESTVFDFCTEEGKSTHE